MAAAGVAKSCRRQQQQGQDCPSHRYSPLCECGRPLTNFLRHPRDRIQERAKSRKVHKKLLRSHRSAELQLARTARLSIRYCAWHGQRLGRHGLTLSDEERASSSIPAIDNATCLRAGASRTRTALLIRDECGAFIIVPETRHALFKNRAGGAVIVRPNLEQRSIRRGPQRGTLFAARARKRQHLGVAAVASDVDGKKTRGQEPSQSCIRQQNVFAPRRVPSRANHCRDL